MTEFNTVVNHLFFNILTGEPDSLVASFIQTYFPYLSKNTEQINWSIVPSAKAIEPQKTEHNLLFHKHPFLRFEFIEGKLEMLSSELENHLPRIRQMRLSFLFKDEFTAKEALDNIIKIFEKVSLPKLTKEEDGHKLTIFRSADKEGDGVMLILSKDELLGKRYKLHFGYETIMRGE